MNYIEQILISLFIPCYFDQAYPHVWIATMELLHQHGFENTVSVNAALLRPALGEQRRGEKSCQNTSEFHLQLHRILLRGFRQVKQLEN